MVQMIWMVLLFVSQVLGIDVGPIANILSTVFQFTGMQ